MRNTYYFHRVVSLAHRFETFTVRETAVTTFNLFVYALFYHHTRLILVSSPFEPVIARMNEKAALIETFTACDSIR